MKFHLQYQEYVGSDDLKCCRCLILNYLARTISKNHAWSQILPSFKIPMMVSTPWTCFVEVTLEMLKLCELSSSTVPRLLYKFSIYCAAENWLVKLRFNTLLWNIGRSFFDKKGMILWTLRKDSLLACRLAVLSGTMHRIRTKTTMLSTKRNSNTIVCAFA